MFKPHNYKYNIKKYNINNKKLKNVLLYLL